MLYYWVYHITLFFGANPMVSQVSDSFPNPNPAAFWRVFPVHCFGEPASAKEGYQRSTSLIGKAEFSIWSSIQKNLRLTLVASMTFPVTGYSSTYALAIKHGWLIKSLLNGSLYIAGRIFEQKLVDLPNQINMIGLVKGKIYLTPPYFMEKNQWYDYQRVSANISQT